MKKNCLLCFLLFFSCHSAFSGESLDSLLNVLDKTIKEADTYVQIKEGNPWLLFCHEWLEAVDGEIYAQRLAKDLKTTEGDLNLLFKASEAPWVGSITSAGVTGNVTDALFIYRSDDDKLIMLWSSFRKKDGKYAIGQAISESGDVLGHWVQESETLNSDDGGHAMVFKDFKGRLMISYHAPNSQTEHPVIIPVYIKDGKFVTLK